MGSGTILTLIYSILKNPPFAFILFSKTHFIILIIPSDPFHHYEGPAHRMEDRLNRFRARMDKTQPGWEMAAITGKVPLYYFTGTMPDGLLIVPHDGDAVFWVRQSYERASDESFFPDLRKMRSYRDVAAGMRKIPREVFLETDLVPIAQLERMQKHLLFTQVKPVDAEVSAVRAKKSPYELSLMERAGKTHRHVLEDCVPGSSRKELTRSRLGATCTR